MVHFYIVLLGKVDPIGRIHMTLGDFAPPHFFILGLVVGLTLAIPVQRHLASGNLVLVGLPSTSGRGRQHTIGQVGRRALLVDLGSDALWFVGRVHEGAEESLGRQVAVDGVDFVWLHELAWVIIYFY